MAMEIFRLLGTVAINKDKALQDIKAIQTQAEKTSTKMGKSFDKAGKYITDHSATFRKMGMAMTIAGGVIALAVKNVRKSFNEYESRLVDMGKVTDESLEVIEDRIRGMPPILGSATELMAGYYQVISAGVKDTSEAMDVLTISSQTAKAAHLDQAQVVEAITKLMAGYEGEVKNAAEAADLLFAIEKEGQVTVAELTPLIGGLAKMSYDLGISQDEMAGSFAVVTKTAGNAADAATQYEAVMTGLLKPTDTMKEAIEDMGFASAEAAIKELGFVEVLQRLEKTTGGNSTAMAELFGRKQALIGVSTLLARSGETLRDTIESVGNKAGGASKAFKEWSETGEAFNDTLKANMENLKIMVGEALDPLMDKLQIKITEVVKGLGDWIKENPKLARTIAEVVAVVGGLMLVLGPLVMLLPSLVTGLGLVAKGFVALQIGSAKLATTLGLTCPQLFAVAAAITLVTKATYGWIEALKESKRIKEMEIESAKQTEEGLKKLQRAYNMTDEELQEFIKTRVLSEEIRARGRKTIEEETESVEESTEATDENTEATEENTEAKKEQAEEIEKLLVGSGLLSANLALVKAEYELTAKTVRDINENYEKQKGILVELVEKLEEELESLRKGTQSYKDKQLEIINTRVELKGLIQAQVELNQVTIKQLTGIDLVNAKLSLQGKLYYTVGESVDYYKGRAVLLLEKNQILLKTLEDLEKQGKKSTEEWFRLREVIADNEIAVIALNEGYKKYVKGEWVKYLEKVALTWNDLQIQMMGLGPLLDELGIKWRDVEKEAVEAAEESGDAWSDFFKDLKAKYSDTLGALQTGISNFVSAFQGAIETALYSLWTMAETNAEIQQEMAETEQKWVDEKERINEEYRQALITMLSDYVDEKELQNMSLAKLEALAQENTSAEYALASLNATKELAKIEDKYTTMLGDMEEEQVTFGSIMSNLWKTLVDAIIKELIRIAAQYIVMWLIGIFLGEGGGIGYKLGGGIKGYDLGGQIKKMEAHQVRAEYFQRGGPKGTDTVPIWATPGEYIISEPMTSFIRKTGAITGDLIKSIRSGSRTPAPSFAGGGLVSDIGGGIELVVMPGAVNINTKYLDDRAISQAGPKLFAEFEKQARNAGKIIEGR